MTKSDLLVLGKVGRPHGLRGAFFVSGREDAIPKSVKKILIGKSPETAEPATISQSSIQAQRPMIVCSLAADRTAAERLTNLNIYAVKSQVRKSKDQDVYWLDLEGAEVLASDGRILGRIVEVYNAGASDIAAIRGDDGRTVDIALSPDYVGDDPKLETTSAGGRRLHLTVPADTFSEVWSDA